MRRNRNILLVITFLLTAFISCKPKALPSGEVKIHVYVKHHSVPIAYSKVYVKSSTLEFPGKDSSLYEYYLTTNAQGYVLIDNIGNGEKKYVLYGKGTDPDWDSTGTTPVWGFQPVYLKTNPGEDKERFVTIPVSE